MFKALSFVEIVLKPKSPTLTRLGPAMKTFSAFKSRWMMLLACYRFQTEQTHFVSMLEIFSVTQKNKFWNIHLTSYVEKVCYNINTYKMQIRQVNSVIYTQTQTKYISDRLGTLRLLFVAYKNPFFLKRKYKV